MTEGATQRGNLILVVGASGVGKDTIINGARARLRANEAVVFAQRTITRQPNASEVNVFATEDEFAAVRERGGFALWWRAHGLDYGIPLTVETFLQNGKSVICNVSRTVLADARARYAPVKIVEIVASPAVVAERLAARGREQSQDVAARLQRSMTLPPTNADAVLHNDAVPDQAIAGFCDLVEKWTLGTPV